MKRGTDNETESSRRKRARSSDRNHHERGTDYQLRCLLSANTAHTLLRRGGDNLARIRSDNRDSTIGISDCRGPERILFISAKDSDTALNTLMHTVTFLEDIVQEKSLRSPNIPAPDVEVRLLFHQIHSGLIIGRSGENIRDLRASTTTALKVYEVCCPRSTDRVVSAIGKVGMVKSAISQMIKLTISHVIKNESKEYDPDNFEEVDAFRYGGFLSTPSSRSSREDIPREEKTRHHSRNPRDYYPDRNGETERRSEQIRGRGSKDNSWENKYREDDERRSRDSRKQWSSRNGKEERRIGDDEKSESSVVHLTIPRNYVGVIIGPAGASIKATRQKTGAEIIISAEVLRNTSYRLITIKGTKNQIREAKFILRESVKQRCTLDTYEP